MDLYNKSFIYRQFVKAINSLIYVFTRRIMYVKAWVNIRFGKVIPNNWGDDINVHLLKMISNREVGVCNCSLIHKFYSPSHYICIGSILGWYEDGKSEIWGSGFISSDSKLNVVPLRIHSVRGKLTRQKLLEQGIECPESYGDPALLLSRFYNPQLAKQYKMGIVAHFVDSNNPIIKDFISKNPDCIIIDLVNYTKWTEIVDKIVSCEKIISSSLHGLITSDSYGIPNKWVSFSDGIAGGIFKFLDYFSSIDRSEKSPIMIDSLESIYQLYNENFSQNHVKIDFESMLTNCPFYYGNK